MRDMKLREDTLIVQPRGLLRGNEKGKAFKEEGRKSSYRPSRPNDLKAQRLLCKPVRCPYLIPAAVSRPKR